MRFEVPAPDEVFSSIASAVRFLASLRDIDGYDGEYAGIIQDDDDIPIIAALLLSVMPIKPNNQQYMAQIRKEFRAFYPTVGLDDRHFMEMMDMLDFFANVHGQNIKERPRGPLMQRDYDTLAQEALIKLGRPDIRVRTELSNFLQAFMAKAYKELAGPVVQRRLVLEYRRARVLAIFLAVLLVSSVVTAAGISNDLRAREAELAETRNDLSTIAASYTEIAAERDSLKKEVSLQRQQLKEHNEELSTATIDLFLAQSDLAFYEDAIALVPVDGNRYHTYNCYTFKKSQSYYAYNVELAQSYGYSPCPLCH